MKKFRIFLPFIIAGSLVFTGCSDDYLDVEPTNSVGVDATMGSAENLMKAINGMHRNMYVRQNSSQGQNGYTAQMIYADVMGDDVVFPSTGNNWFISELRWVHTNNPNNGSLAYPWRYWYSMIRNANNIITYGPNATGDEKLKNNAIGQAYAYRAFSHFQLVQLYGKRYVAGGDNSSLGVVITLDPDNKEPKARSTVEETYAQIWKDLDQAETLLTDISQSNNSHFSLQTVQGLKARIALVQQNYAKALEFAQKARTENSFMTQAQYKLGFNDYTNPEWMWGIKIVEDQTDYFGNFHAYMSRNYNSTQIRQAPKVVNINLYNAFPDSDVRKQVIDPTGAHADLELPTNYSKFPHTSQKFLSESINVSLGDVPFMRVAEMYLIEAEAQYMLGNEAASKETLKTLISARDTEFTDFTTSGAAYLEELLLNRRLELWGEGFRIFDLKRLNRPLDRRNANFNGTVINNLYEVSVTDPRWQWLIPTAEINANPLIDQNPS